VSVWMCWVSITSSEKMAAARTQIRKLQHKFALSDACQAEVDLEEAIT